MSDDHVMFLKKCWRLRSRGVFEGSKINILILGDDCDMC